MDGLVIKFKGARPNATKFPDSDHMYRVAPLSFRNIFTNRYPHIMSRHEFFGSDLEAFYRTLFSETGFKTVERKWDKERVYCFGDDEEIQDNAYNTLRLEERIFSKRLVDVAKSVSSQINHPKMFAKITQGSHSPNFGMGAGDYMSWFDGDVNIMYVLDVPTKDLLSESIKLMPGITPESAGSRIFYTTHNNVVFPSLPISNDVSMWNTDYGISFVSAEDFLNNKGGLVMWKFIVENGFPLHMERNHELMKLHSKSFYTYPGFSSTELSILEENQILKAISRFSDGTSIGNDKVMQFHTDKTLPLYDKIVAIIDEEFSRFNDFSWTTNVCYLPNIEFIIKNKTFRIVGNHYL